MSAYSHHRGNSSPLPILTKARKIHKWLMALVGIQLFVWAMTGAYMVFPNIHYIHGDHLIKHTMDNLDATALKLSFNQVLNRYPTATNIRLGWLGNKAIYRFTYFNDDTQQSIQVMLDANSGISIGPLKKADISSLVPQLLAMSKVTETLIDSVVLIDANSDDYPNEIGSRGLPLWQVQLNTWNNTRLYISKYTGEVAYVRHHAWRLFDLFWRLHIMDYIGGDEPENWLLAISSIVSLCAILAGLVLLYFKMLSAIGNKHARPISCTSSTKKSIRAIAKKSHKWLALIVFIQLLLWVGSGFMLARIDHSLATGQVTKLSKPALSKISENEVKQLISISEIFEKKVHVESVHLELLMDKWVFRLQHKKGSHNYMESDFTMLDAKTGDQVLITKEIASQLALASYKKEGLAKPLKIISTSQYHFDIPELPQEQNSVWQISVNDASNTKIILNAQTGGLIAHVNNETPLRNLLFKLHFMDYANEGSFNNLFIKLFALFTLVLAFTGMYWLFELVKDKQFAIPSVFLSLFKPKKVDIKVMYSNPISDSQTEYNYTIRVNSNLTILDALAKNDITLESLCGGGGTCGKCICQLNVKTRVGSAEKELLTEEQLEQNFRLACQHRIRSAKRITIYR